MRKFWEKNGPNNKVKLVFNHLGQPCGLKTPNLSNFIAYCVKGKEVSVAYVSWRKVQEGEKIRLWKLVKAFFEIEDCHKGFVMKSASKKWRAFRSFLRKKYYDATKTTKENIADGCDKRVHEKQWAWLVHYWKSDKYLVSICQLWYSLNCAFLL